MFRRLFALGLSFCLVGTPFVGRLAWGQADTKDERKDDEPEVKKDARRPRSTIRPYDQVVTSEAKTSPGLFMVHRLDDKVFFEIPESAFGDDMLWVTQMEKTQTGFGFAGSPLGHRVVRWEIRGDDVLLRDVNYTIRAAATDPIHDAVEATSLAPIIEVFPIRAFGKDKAPVIDATSLFTADLPEFSARRRLNASGVDSKRSFIEKIKAFPENIEAKVLLTYRLRDTPGGAGGGRGGPAPPRDDRGAVTVMLHHSMVKLPEQLMRPRRYDDRVGFFTEKFEDYADVSNHQVEEVQYITRWRLEKKDPKAEVSEPKKPIVFYIGREVPAKWRAWVKKGIEAWQPAFEAAGFKNAIIAKDAPTPREDADWDAEDARFSSIRWLPATIENAMGPHVHDPRTGEILESDIIIYHNILKLIRDWYFVQASPNDPRAQKLPLSDDLVGECLAYVVAHEVGHTLGFPHNMKASSSYTVEQLRDPEFTRTKGTEASIMDYGRFNYVAQPGDGARLIPVIGPYDKFAVEWGYKEFQGAKNYEAEKAKLDEIVARQLTNPMLRFGNPNPAEDPSQQTEDLGSDAIAATALGLKNLDRVASYLVKATTTKNEDYSLLRNMYTQLNNQRVRELTHVANVVGGVVHNNVWFGDGDRAYNAVSGEQQRKAVQFLNENAFQTPAALVDPDILLRLEPTGAADRILAGQSGLLRTLLGETRLKRMAELATRDKTGAYLPINLLDDLTSGIWGDLKSSSGEIDLYRRNLQRSYVETLIAAVEQPKATTDLPALARGELRKIVENIDSGAGRTQDVTTRLHLDDIKARITQALDPHRPTPSDRIAEAPSRRPTDRDDPAP
jgi:Met-zincin/Domain of unknown function (DUF5117)/Domain of unknown function (DUF5118)